MYKYIVYAANGRSDGEIRAPDDPPGKAVSMAVAIRGCAWRRGLELPSARSLRPSPVSASFGWRTTTGAEIPLFCPNAKFET